VGTPVPLCLNLAWALVVLRSLRLCVKSHVSDFDYQGASVWMWLGKVMRTTDSILPAILVPLMDLGNHWGINAAQLSSSTLRMMDASVSLR
jgi:hypothetical protein